MSIFNLANRITRRVELAYIVSDCLTPLPPGPGYNNPGRSIRRRSAEEGECQ